MNDEGEFMLIRWLMLILLLFAPSAGASPAILVFGDSLSAGYGIASEAGWVSLLQQRLTNHHYAYRVINASISGETTMGGRTRIKSVLAAHKPAIVILALGANDGLRGLPLEPLKANLDAIIQACHADRARVLLIGMRLPPNYGVAYMEHFSDIYPALAKKHKTPLLPFLLEGMGDKRELFQADNHHPTAAAQAIVMENVWARLKPML
jgi:acyl-CoA thioesterase-1